MSWTIFTDVFDYIPWTTFYSINGNLFVYIVDFTLEIRVRRARHVSKHEIIHEQKPNLHQVADPIENMHTISSTVISYVCANCHFSLEGTVCYRNSAFKHIARSSTVIDRKRTPVWHRSATSWWHHQMETFSALLAICAGNSPVPGEFPTQRPATRSFDVFFDRRLNKRLSK